MHLRIRRAGSRSPIVALAASFVLATSLTAAAGLTAAAAQPGTPSGPPAAVDCDAATHPTEDVQLPSGSGTKWFTCWVIDDWRKSVTSSTKVSAEVLTAVNDPENPDAATFSAADYWCFTGGSGMCSMPVHQAEGELGTTTICFHLESAPQGGVPCASEPWDEALDPDATDAANDLEDSARVTWHPATPFVDRLDAAPDEANRWLGHETFVNAGLFDQFGNPYTAAATTIGFELFAGSPSDTDGNSPSTPDATCSTASGKSGCFFKYSRSATAGWDSFCVWVGATPAMGTDADGQETCNGETVADPDEMHGIYAHAPGDKVDVVRVAWFSGPQRGLDCDDQPNTAGSDHQAVPTLEGAASQVTYTCTVRNDGGGAVTGTDFAIRAEVRGPVNDPDATDGASFGSSDYTCNTGSDAVCTITVGQAEGETGATEICFYLGTAKEGQSLCSWEPRDEGPIGVFGDSANDLADTATVSWEVRSPATGGLDVEPERNVLRLGSKQVVTATVYDQFGSPYAGQTAVKFRFLPQSPNWYSTPNSLDPHSMCWTNGSSTCAITVTSDTAGRDRICAWLHVRPQLFCDEEPAVDGDDDPGVMDPPSPPDDDIDHVELYWEAPQALGGGVDAEPESATIGLKKKYVLSATVYDQFGDELPANTVVNFELFSGSPGDSDGNTWHSPDMKCTTSSASTCSVAFTSITAGTTRICVWTNATPGMLGTNLTGTCDGEGLTDADDAADVRDAPSPSHDDVDVVQVVWQT